MGSTAPSRHGLIHADHRLDFPRPAVSGRGLDCQTPLDPEKSDHGVKSHENCSSSFQTRQIALRNPSHVASAGLSVVCCRMARYNRCHSWRARLHLHLFGFSHPSEPQRFVITALHKIFSGVGAPILRVLILQVDV